MCREQEFMSIDMEGRHDYLLGGHTDLRHRMREVKREREDTRERA